jgi:Holliday junction resolvasome RuvABC endonuclease subunit
MKTNEFYSKYANTPINKRLIKLNFIGMNMTLHEIYERLHELEKQIRPQQCEIEKLLMEADFGFSKLNKGKL